MTLSICYSYAFASAMIVPKVCSGKSYPITHKHCNAIVALILNAYPGSLFSDDANAQCPGIGQVVFNGAPKKSFVASYQRAHSPRMSWIPVLQQRERSMSRYRVVASAVLTVAINHLLAQPAKLSLALGAFHVATSSILLDAL